MQVIKKTKIIDKEVVIKPAYFEDVDTGEVRVINVKGQDGKIKTIDQPILNRTNYPAVKEVKQDTVDVFTVAHENEEHEFTSNADAKQFIKDIRKAEK